MFTELFPILATPDLARALEFYRGLLGATVTYEFKAPDGDVVYAGLEVGDSHFGIGFDPAYQVPGHRSMSLWVYTDDCDRALERLRSTGVTITQEPADQPWGERVARVLDPDDNELIVGQKATPRADADHDGETAA